MRPDTAISKKCYLCGSGGLELLRNINERPRLETDFGIPGGSYNRAIYICTNCGVYNNIHEYDFEKIYKGSYNKATYQNDIKSRYDKIMSLSFDRSDNKNRVKRIEEFFKKKSGLNGMRVLDVGSGLCVFLGEMIKRGVQAYCIDPDPMSVSHARESVGVKEAFQGDFGSYKSAVKFDLISFNKVLEHVKDPASFMMEAKGHLSAAGIVYIELPDGSGALNDDDLINREEFYIEHYTIFTERAVRHLASSCAFDILEMKAVKEPSMKYTIYAFLSAHSLAGGAR